MIETLELFPELSSALIKLLREISDEDWNRPSPIPGRTIKDLVSHLTDGSLRKLSIQRDQHSSTKVRVDIQNYEDLVAYIQKLNTDWMDTTDRLSPRVMIDLLEYAEKELHEFHLTLDPVGKALFSVAWAGEEESENWFDIAREYTEKWHHQMQIRLSLDRPLLMDPRYTEPLYDTFMMGLPHLFRDLTEFPEGDVVRITITGKLNKSWHFRNDTAGWLLADKADSEPAHIVEIPEDLAWILFTNTDRNKEAHRSRIISGGSQIFAERLLHYVTVMS